MVADETLQRVQEELDRIKASEKAIRKRARKSYVMWSISTLDDIGRSLGIRIRRSAMVRIGVEVYRWLFD